MIVKLRMCMRTHPVGDLAGHRSDHDDATRSLLFNKNAREVFGGDEGTKDAKEDLVSISAFKQVMLFFSQSTYLTSSILRYPSTG